VRKRLSSLKASPENSQLYRDAENDPDIDALARSIRKRGLQEPLIVTADNYIVSGHRRYAALSRIGQVVAPCRVLDVRRDSMTTDDYVALLREHNRQRSKTIAEQLREELVDINPAEAHRHLSELRDKSIYSDQHSDVQSLMIEGTKVRHGISGQKAEHVAYVKKVIFEDRRSYWPLSVRGVHYPLLNYTFLRNIPRKLPYKNDDESYSATSDLLTRMRLNGEVPWEALTDGTRPLTLYRPFNDAREFVRQEVRNLFDGYWRDLLQTQQNHVEVVVEKNTIYHMVLRVTDRFQIPTSSGRGFNSIDPWHELYKRYRDSQRERLIVIVLSDFDPEGEQIPQVGGRTLRDDFGVDEDDLTIIKAGVTTDQIQQYGLPEQNFAKETSSNYDWFVNRNGGDTNVYELEALDPADMLRDLEQVITGVLDMDLFNLEAQREQDESAYLEAARNIASEALKGLAE
jgi:ParB/Sulfiredoxin domain